MFTVEPLVISDEERSELERRARAHTATQREARRARVILLCAEGVPLRQIDGSSASISIRSGCGGVGSWSAGWTGWSIWRGRVDRGGWAMTNG